MRRQRKNIFDEIKYVGHDEDFEPMLDSLATGAACGTIEKLDVFRSRLDRGEALFHPGDNPKVGTHAETAMCNAYCKEAYRKRKRESERLCTTTN